jgi:type II secretory pathway pseudopilin PulG
VGFSLIASIIVIIVIGIKRRWNVSLSFSPFLLSNVDSEAVEQEDDNCFGVVRCHHGLRFHA